MPALPAGPARGNGFCRDTFRASTARARGFSRGLRAPGPPVTFCTHKKSLKRRRGHPGPGHLLLAFGQFTLRTPFFAQSVFIHGETSLSLNESLLSDLQQVYQRYFGRLCPAGIGPLKGMHVSYGAYRNIPRAARQKFLRRIDRCETSPRKGWRPKISSPGQRQISHARRQVPPKDIPQPRRYKTTTYGGSQGAGTPPVRAFGYFSHERKVSRGPGAEPPLCHRIEWQ